LPLQTCVDDLKKYLDMKLYCLKATNFEKLLGSFRGEVVVKILLTM
jgi:hypothetical protein